MAKSIATFVFFDLETTGLPHQERNQTKIVELCFVAASKKDILLTSYGNIPHTKTFELLLNPNRKIHPKVTELTGLCNGDVRMAPVFDEKINQIIEFLEVLPKPVCLVAHNGNLFDYKIFNTECEDIGQALPYDLLCVDSLTGFKHLLKGTSISYDTLCPIANKTNDCVNEQEDVWPELNLSAEELDEIDQLCLVQSMNAIKLDDSIKSDRVKEKTDEKDKKKVKSKKSGSAESFALSALYMRLLNKKESNAHRAKADCMMLLECVVSVKGIFLPWAEESCKPLSEIKPLHRY